MIEHVDAALTALVRACVPAGVLVCHDPPNRELADTGGLVSLFLHRVEEDVDARAAAWSDELDSQGRVVARLLPPRRYRCCYLVTAWAADRATEHAWLGAVLTATAAYRQVPVEFLPAELLDCPPVDLDVAHPRLPGLAADLWTSLGVAPRTGLDVVLSVLVTPEAITALPEPPSTVDLGVLGEPSRPAPAPPSEVVPPRRRIRE